MDFGNIVVSLSIIQAFLLIILLLEKKKVQFPTIYLVYLIFGLIYFQLEFLLVRNAAKLSMKNVLLTAYGGWLLTGPLLYFFIRSIYHKSEVRKLVLHLLPFLLISILLPLFLNEPVPKRGFDYGMLSVFKYRNLGLTTFNSFYGLVFFLQFLHFGIYIWLSYRFSKKQRTIPQEKLIQQLLIVLVILYLCCLVFYAVLLTSSFYDREWDYFLIIPTALVIYFISYSLLSNPQWWRSDLKLKNGKKYERSEMSQTEMIKMMNQLDQIIKEQKLYKEPDLSLDGIAQKMDVSRHKISQAINRQRDMTFNDYINRFRVEEAKRLILTSNGSKSMLDIAFDAGFNNKATFNTNFKKITGKTPSAFKKSNIQSD